MENLDAIFEHVDDLDWDYLERVLVNTMRSQEDSQTRIWIDVIKRLRKMVKS